MSLLKKYGVWGALAGSYGIYRTSGVVTDFTQAPLVSNIPLYIPNIIQWGRKIGEFFIYPIRNNQTHTYLSDIATQFDLSSLQQGLAYLDQQHLNLENALAGAAFLYLAHHIHHKRSARAFNPKVKSEGENLEQLVRKS